MHLSKMNSNRIKITAEICIALITSLLLVCNKSRADGRSSGMVWQRSWNSYINLARPVIAAYVASFQLNNQQSAKQIKQIKINLCIRNKKGEYGRRTYHGEELKQLAISIKWISIFQAVSHLN